MLIASLNGLVISKACMPFSTTLLIIIATKADFIDQLSFGDELFFDKRVLWV